MEISVWEAESSHWKNPVLWSVFDSIFTVLALLTNRRGSIKFPKEGSWKSSATYRPLSSREVNFSSPPLQLNRNLNSVTESSSPDEQNVNFLHLQFGDVSKVQSAYQNARETIVPFLLLGYLYLLCGLPDSVYYFYIFTLSRYFDEFRISIPSHTCRPTTPQHHHHTTHRDTTTPTHHHITHHTTSPPQWTIDRKLHRRFTSKYSISYSLAFLGLN